VNEELQHLCKKYNVDFDELYSQINMAANQVGPDVIIRADLTIAQYRVLRACLEVAGGL
jgi:hypothetical protein